MVKSFFFNQWPTGSPVFNITENIWEHLSKLFIRLQPVPEHRRDETHKEQGEEEIFLRCFRLYDLPYRILTGTGEWTAEVQNYFVNRCDREARLRKTSNVRRGCTFYGHSCFGGHGKRSDESMDLQEQPDLYEQRLKSSEFFRQWLQAYRTGQVLE
ncbi:uncharacterized protein LOC112127582 isoform X2 [Cimex lectularius]|uniref:Uncharacterized protein n=1 Tax=Cimex lectularius TaxID=79782 RepID=A0A8I6SR80_CIMLE|nr:uncharacterized protein LOC112127582 isoform X2 [Cimex lectularius]